MYQSIARINRITNTKVCGNVYDSMCSNMYSNICSNMCNDIYSNINREGNFNLQNFVNFSKKGLTKSFSTTCNNVTLKSKYAHKSLTVPQRRFFKYKNSTNISIKQSIRNMELYAKDFDYNKCNNNCSLNGNTKLLVCDMAGTVINENSIVYDSLYKSIKDTGYFDITREDINAWHGVFKNRVITHFVDNECDPSCPVQRDDLFNMINSNFTEILHEEYFSENSKISLIDEDLLHFFENIRTKGVKISLNTGYTEDLQKKLIEKFNLQDYVDYYISSDKVKNGRPYPYMIYRIMEELEIKDVKTVAKIGDSVNDIYEGHNAGCSQVIGVLSGAASKKDLLAANATSIVENITKLKLY